MSMPKFNITFTVQFPLKDEKNMKKVTMDKLLHSLEDMWYEVTVPREISERAKKALDRMIEVLPE